MVKEVNMKNTSFKVSIITCFFNVENFIEQTIKSVIKQKYKNWELLLIDDGSSDKSTDIAKKYSVKYPGKILYHDHENHANKGLSYSRNSGISKSSGEIIAFLDADDVWLSTYLSNQVNILSKYNCAMVCEATEYWYSWNKSDVDTMVLVGTKQDQIYSPPQLMIDLYPLGEGAAPCVCGILIKKASLEKYGGFDKDFKGLYEDQIFLSRMYLNENIFISSACNNRYRQRHDSLVGASYEDGEYISIRKHYLEWLRHYIHTNKIEYDEVNKLLQRALEYHPLVSVIICFYNEEQFLKEAIASVLGQEYRNWQLLLVDDGSSDKSSNIALEYAEKFPTQIIYCEHENHSNKGLSASRNLGIKKSNGELISFLDADDVWLPKKLLTQVSIFQRNHDIGMTAEASLYWNDWSNSKNKNIEIAVGTASEFVYEPYELICDLYPLGKGAAPVPSGLMIKKEAIERSGYFDESFIKEYSLYEDQVFLSKMYLQEKVYISSACNNLYRQRTNSIVTSVRAKGHYHDVREYFLKWLENFLQIKKIYNKRLNRLLKKALFPYRYPKTYYIVHDVPRKIWWQIRKYIPTGLRKFVRRRILRKQYIM